MLKTITCPKNDSQNQAQNVPTIALPANPNNIEIKQVMPTEASNNLITNLFIYVNYAFSSLRTL